MKRWTLFPLGLAALLPSVGVPSLSHAQTETGGVAPTAPQAEDRPDVGDSPDAPATPPPAPLKKQLDIPWDDSTFRGRYEAYQEAVEAFETEAREAREQIRQIGERKYKERRAKVESNFKRQLDPTLEAERGRRVEAIAAFQAFLAQHPEDHEYAPDAIFRLAELYYERTDDEFQQAQAAWKLAYQAWKEQGGQGAPPAEPTRRFDETVALYQRLIANYPEYRFIDGAYYLLGYTLRAQGDTAPGLAAWSTLVTRYPTSRFYPEVWFRIGDSYFDEEKWDLAVDAFLHVTPLKQSDYYDKGLYKLAWTYYLVNRFDQAVTSFFELLDFSYAKKNEKEEGGSVLEEEAVQYVAISFGDDNWKHGPEYTKLIRGKRVDDPAAETETDYVAFAIDWFKRAGDKPYQRDIMAKLGDNLFKQSRNLQAIQALEFAISLDPLHKDAPKLQDQVVQAWVRERQFDKATAARDLLVKTYGRDGAWAKKWGNDSDVLRSAEDYARINLYQAALYYHQQASQYFNDNRQDLGVQYFRAASVAYKQYLSLYPHDKNAYELGYYLAETYYYSLRFDEAVTQYELNRDSTAGTKYRAESALNAVYSYEKILDAAIVAGTLPKKEITTGKREGAPTAAQSIPELRMRYIRAIDAFLQGGAEHEMAPAFGYRAGEVFYSYGQYDEAVKRFQIVVERYPTTEAARFAANLILDDMLARKDWKAAAAAADRFKANNVGGADTEGFSKIQGGARFNIARETLEQGDKLMADGRITEGIAMLESGADQYLALLKEDPAREFADVMMYNAALSFEKARRPTRAADLYERLYKEYPKSEWAPEAMFRVANKSEQAFQFDKAVDTYLGLVKQYPKSERRADAQINAALALEGQQKYERAASEFERFATLFPDKPEAADVFFRATLVHKKRKAPAAEVLALKRFVTRYQSVAAQAPRVIEAQARMGEIYADDKGDAKAKKQSVEAYQAAVKGFPRAAGNANAAYFAAKAAFALAEDEYNAYRRLGVFSKIAKQQSKELEAKSARLQKVESTYKSIITTYKAAEWSLASLYRIGALYDNMQQAVLKSPCPDDVRRQFGDVGCDEYRNLIEDNAFAVEEKAVANYKIAFEKSRELRLSNAWTKRTLESLNLLRPQDYPIDKEPLVRPVVPGARDLGLALPDGGSAELKALGAGPAERAQKGGA